MQKASRNEHLNIVGGRSPGPAWDLQRHQANGIAHVGRHVRWESVVTSRPARYRTVAISRERDEMVLDGGQLARLVDCALQIVIAAHAEEVVGEIVFALPLQFDRRVRPSWRWRRLRTYSHSSACGRSRHRRGSGGRSLCLRSSCSILATCVKPLSACWLGVHISMVPLCHQAVLFSGSSC